MADDRARPRFSYIPGLDGIRGIWVVIGPLLYHAATDTVSGGILGIFDYCWTLRLTQAFNHYYRSKLFQSSLVKI